MGLFQDSLKKWFYTNNSSAASSDARVPLLNANGTPKGSDTMANLASVLGGVYLSFSSGMSTATTTANTPYNLLEIENNGTVLFLFSYAGRRGIYAANQDKITEIAPSRAVNINQEEGSHKLYVDASSRKVYFTSVNSQSISWKILQVL